MMKSEALKKLRSKLPRGYGEELAKRTGKTTSSVYQALTGKINSPLIIEAAIQLAKESQDKQDDLTDQIDSL